MRVGRRGEGGEEGWGYVPGGVGMITHVKRLFVLALFDLFIFFIISFLSLFLL